MSNHKFRIMSINAFETAGTPNNPVIKIVVGVQKLFSFRQI